jgi:hypothetical protein
LHRLFAFAQLFSTRLGLGQRGLGSLRNHAAFLFGHGRVDVQHERIDIPAQRGDDEWNFFSTSGWR